MLFEGFASLFQYFLLLKMSASNHVQQLVYSLSPKLFMCICVVIIFAEDNCNKFSFECDEDFYCTQVYTEISYPDPDTGFSTRGITTNSNYLCSSMDYLDFMKLLNSNITCIHTEMNSRLDYWIPFNTDDCFEIPNIAIGVNQTLIACDTSYTPSACIDIFTKAISNDNEYCDEISEHSQFFNNISDCYATDDFVEYLLCKESTYDAYCPAYDILYHLRIYAICACKVMNGTKAEFGWNETWKYFTELSEVVIDIFMLLGDWQQNCPEYIFACNSFAVVLMPKMKRFLKNVIGFNIHCF